MNSYSEQINRLQNVAEFIAGKVEEMIFTGSYAPGKRLIQTDIAEYFGVSRLPVRDALRILEKKELVVTVPRKGVFVRTFSIKEIEDLFEYRRVLETHALTVSLPLLKEQDIVEAEAIIANQQSVQSDNFLVLMDIDERFHRKLWSKCDNEEIKKSLSVIWNRIKVLRAYESNVQTWVERSVQIHQKIIQEIKNAHFEEAIVHLEQAIQRSCSAITCILESALSPRT